MDFSRKTKKTMIGKENKTVIPLLLEGTVTPANMLSEIVTAIGTSLGALVGNLAAAVGSAMTIFWDPAANSGAGALTSLGNVFIVMFAIGFGVIILYKVFDLLSGFFARR